MADISNKAQERPRFKYITQVITLIFFIFAYWFWAFPFRAALSYREQMQLFLATGEYAGRFVAWPGGPAAYAGEFLTQFFNNYYIGAAIMSLLLTLTLVSSKRLCLKTAPSASSALALTLSFIPAVALWLCMGEAAVTAALPVAVTVSIAFCLLLTGTKADYLLIVVGLSLLYWLIGPMMAVSAALAIAYRITRGTGTGDKAVFAAVTVVTAVANVFVWKVFLTYPFSYQLIGRGYTLIPDSLTPMQPVVMAACVAAPVIASLLKKANRKVAVTATAVVIAAAAVSAWPSCYDKATYKLINYDYYVRANDWNGLLDYASKNAPDLPLSVSATNLAMGMTGQLDSRAFGFFQKGPEGLVPTFTKETLSSFNTGEILFQLGMINDAQRFYFEGMEAIPNYNKSSRAMRRLAETAMIRGDVKVAEKYLNLLTNTIFYRKWAQRNLELLHTPGGVDSHPLYGTLRRRMPQTDYMFSEGEIDKSIGQLFIKDPTNGLARQYLVVYPLLERNLDKFMQYMQVVSEAQPGYTPILAQQAAAFYFMNQGKTPPPAIVPQPVVTGLQQFARAWSTKDEAALAPFAGSLYLYLVRDNSR